MPRSGRNGPVALAAIGILGLVVICYLIWTGSAQRQFYADTAHYQSARAADRAKDEFWRCIESLSFPECAKAAIATSQESQAAQYDLAAQREMADWAFWTFLSGVVAATAAGIGVVYLAHNNNITREIGKAQVRAYLFLETHEISFNPIGAAACTFIVKNFGNSPALDIQLGGALLLKGADWQWPDDEKEWVNPKPSSVNIPPGGTNHFIFTSDEGSTFTAETTTSVRKGETVLYGRAVANYRDVFGEPHETIFHFCFSGEDCWRTNKPRIASKGNRAT